MNTNPTTFGSLRKKSAPFAHRSIYKVKRHSFAAVAKQKVSFLVALLSLFAFVTGNMVGQHGWYAFWKTVMGKEDDALIVFVGTVPPIARIPDYQLWGTYGGSKQLHAYNQVPQNVLRDLPKYDRSALLAPDDSFTKQVYSTMWAGGYSTPSGSHAGVDIDAPRGTPVVAIANGFVQVATEQSYGYGNHVMVRHPNTPDSERPGQKTTLYSTYAHLDTLLVQPGDVVHKGQLIGTVGNTGLTFGATGYHLYFQIDKKDAPFHPYWPFTAADARAANLSFYEAVNSTLFQKNLFANTVNPMEFVQQYISYTPPSVEVAQTANAERKPLTVAERRAERLKLAAERTASKPVAVVTYTVASVDTPVEVAPVAAPASQESAPSPVVEPKVTEVPVPDPTSDIDHVVIETTGKILRTWQKVTVRAVDRNGDTVENPTFSGKLYLLSDFGDAEIRPSELTPLDFDGGVATINVLTRGKKTTFINARGAFNATSGPMIAER